MRERTLRRKLQKKMKHKPYRKCPKCGERMHCKLVDGDHDGWHLFKYCGTLFFHGQYYSSANARCQPAKLVNGTTHGCGHFEELHWSGGGIGRHIPHVSNDDRGKA